MKLIARFISLAALVLVSAGAHADYKDVQETKYIECLANLVRGVDDGVQPAANIAKKIPAPVCAMQLQLVVSAATSSWNDTEKMNSTPQLARAIEDQDRVKAVELFRSRLTPEDRESQEQVKLQTASASRSAADAEERRRVEALVQQELLRVAAEKYMQCAIENVKNLDDRVSGADVVARGIKAGCAGVLQPLGTEWASALEKSMENNLVNVVLQYRARTLAVPPSNKAAPPPSSKAKVQS